jgi:hypothetical protein
MDTERWSSTHERWQTGSAARAATSRSIFDTYNSFAVNGRAQRSADITNRYGVSGTPALVVKGKYLTGPSMTVSPDDRINYERFFRALDRLIALARKERGGA